MKNHRRRRPLPVRCQSVLPIGLIFEPHKPSNELPFPVSEPNVVLTYSGTGAAYQAFHTLGLSVGSTVLYPSYNCGHEIEPLTRLGLCVECYRIKDELQLDLEDIENRIKGDIKALLVTHYFGFAQPLTKLRQLCDQYGIFLVEDCAHAFLSDNADQNLARYQVRSGCFFRRSFSARFYLATRAAALLAGSRAVEELHGPTSVNCFDPDLERCDEAASKQLSLFGRGTRGCRILSRDAAIAARRHLSTLFSHMGRESRRRVL